MKLNIVARLQHWMDSVPGQTFLNYAYSWGASVVILGALFKLTHLPGGNVMLFIGMGTEVVVFFLAAFDRPFDKNEVGKELPQEVDIFDERFDREDFDESDLSRTEGEAHGGQSTVQGTPAVVGGGGIVVGGGAVASEGTGVVVQGGGTGVQGIGGTVIIGGGSVAGGSVSTPADHTPAEGAEEPAAPTAEEKKQDAIAAARAAIAAATPEGQEPLEQEAARLAAIIRAANDELLRRAEAVLAPEMEEATGEYIEKLRTLSETFRRIDEQSARLAADSQEMEELSRTLTGINKVYELHLKSISLQVGTIEGINEQTQHLRDQIERLNAVYARMIDAMTVNMPKQ